MSSIKPPQIKKKSDLCYLGHNEIIMFPMQLILATRPKESSTSNVNSGTSLSVHDIHSDYIQLFSKNLLIISIQTWQPLTILMYLII